MSTAINRTVVLIFIIDDNIICLFIVVLVIVSFIRLQTRAEPALGWLRPKPREFA